LLSAIEADGKDWDMSCKKILSRGSIVGLFMYAISHPQIGLSATDSSTTGASFYVGGLAGAAFLNSNYGTNIDLAAEGGKMISDNINVGLRIGYNGLSGFTGGLTGSMFNILPHATYSLTSILQGLYAGGKAGVAFRTINNPGVPPTLPPSSDSTLFLELGPSVGYDYVIGKGVSVGGQINYLFGLSSGLTLTRLETLGAVKYWF